MENLELAMESLIDFKEAIVLLRIALEQFLGSLESR
jgi:hypothetical protein